MVSQVAAMMLLGGYHGVPCGCEGKLYSAGEHFLNCINCKDLKTTGVLKMDQTRNRGEHAIAPSNGLFV